MDITTIVGLIAGFTLIVMGILSGGELGVFIDAPSFLITLGGTMAAFLISTPLAEAVRLVERVMLVFFFSNRYYANVHPEMFGELKLRKPEPASDEEIAKLRIDLASGARLLRRIQPYPIRIGALGSMIGVINMLAHLDVDALAPGFAVASLTLFYGVLITYLMIMPMAQKLEARLKSLDEPFWR